MNWRTERIKSLAKKIVDGEEYVKLADVIGVLDRKCGSCRYFEYRIEEKGRRIKKTGYCINAVNMYRTNERTTYASDMACKRFATHTSPNVCRMCSYCLYDKDGISTCREARSEMFGEEISPTGTCEYFSDPYTIRKNKIKGE